MFQYTPMSSSLGHKFGSGTAELHTSPMFRFMSDFWLCSKWPNYFIFSSLMYKLAYFPTALCTVIIAGRRWWLNAAFICILIESFHVLFCYMYIFLHVYLVLCPPRKLDNLWLLNFKNSPNILGIVMATHEAEGMGRKGRGVICNEYKALYEGWKLSKRERTYGCTALQICQIPLRCAIYKG